MAVFEGVGHGVFLVIDCLANADFVETGHSMSGRLKKTRIKTAQSKLKRVCFLYAITHLLSATLRFNGEHMPCMPAKLRESAERPIVVVIMR